MTERNNNLGEQHEWAVSDDCSDVDPYTTIVAATLEEAVDEASAMVLSDPAAYIGAPHAPHVVVTLTGVAPNALGVMPPDATFTVTFPVFKEPTDDR